MTNPKQIFQNNRRWAEALNQQDPELFSRLSRQQAPNVLWIGCADSRVPATQLCGLEPGEVFVHRNVANLVVHTDLNCLSVVQYAVAVLKVKHVVVCGHYSCGGVQAALGNTAYGPIDNWLRHIKDIARRRQEELNTLDGQAKKDRMCELNVAAQVENLIHTTIVQEAWARGQELSVHGWIYGLGDGLLKDLELTVTGVDGVEALYRMTD